MQGTHGMKSVGSETSVDDDVIDRLRNIENAGSFSLLSFDIVASLDKDKRLSARAKQIWNFLYRNSKYDSNKHDRRVSFSAKQIANACACTRNPVNVAISELLKYKYIEKENNFAQNGAKLKNTYKILFPCDMLKEIEKKFRPRRKRHACPTLDNINNIKTLSNFKNNIVEAGCDVGLVESQNNHVDLDIKNQSQDEYGKANTLHAEDILSQCFPAKVLEEMADTKAKHDQCTRLIESGKIKTASSLPEDLKQSFTLWQPYRNMSIQSAYSAFVGCVNKAIDIGETVGGMTLHTSFSEAKKRSRLPTQELISKFSEVCLNICQHKIILPEITFGDRGRRPPMESTKDPELNLGKSKPFTEELQSFIANNRNAKYIRSKYPEAMSSMDELTRLADEDKQFSKSIHELTPDQRAQIIGRLKKLSNSEELPNQYTANWSLFREVAFYAKYCFQPKGKSIDEAGRIKFGINVAIKMIKDGMWGTPKHISRVGIRIRELLSQLEKIIFNSSKNRKGNTWLSGLGLCGA